MSKFLMDYFFILTGKPRLTGAFGSFQKIDRDPPEPDEEERNKAEEQLAEEAGAQIRNSCCVKPSSPPHCQANHAASARIEYKQEARLRSAGQLSSIAIVWAMAASPSPRCVSLNHQFGAKWPSWVAAPNIKSSKMHISGEYGFPLSL
jgi:hypothetical protein